MPEIRVGPCLRIPDREPQAINLSLRQSPPEPPSALFPSLTGYWSGREGGLERHWGPRDGANSCSHARVAFRTGAKLDGRRKNHPPNTRRNAGSPGRSPALPILFPIPLVPARPPPHRGKPARAESLLQCQDYQGPDPNSHADPAFSSSRCNARERAKLLAAKRVRLWADSAAGPLQRCTVAGKDEPSP
jgi:hypothetical protein